MRDIMGKRASIGTVLKFLRLKHHVDVIILKSAGISVSTMQKLESNKANPRFNTLIKYLVAIHSTLSEFTEWYVGDMIYQLD